MIPRFILPKFPTSHCSKLFPAKKVNANKAGITRGLQQLKMASGYNDRLTKGVFKGICGSTEYFDDDETIKEKSTKLAKLIEESNYVIAFTGM